MGRGLLLLAMVLLGLVVPKVAQAQQYSCSATAVPDLNFGRVEVNPTTAAGTTTQVVVTCSGRGNTGGTRLKVCIGISQPLIGSSRAMRDGWLGFFGTPLLYDIRRDSHTGAVIERDYNNAIGYVVLDTPDGPGNSRHRGSISMTLYGTIVPGQSGLPGGQYRDLLVQGQVRSSTDLSPSTGCVGDPDDTFSLAAYAQVEESCTILAEPLRFGTHYDLSGNITSSAGLGLTCTADTAYTITLDGGNVGNPGARQMRLNGVGPQVINYGLYQDSGHNRPWGNQLATSVQGTGTGTPATLTVHGLVPGGQPAPAIGTYTDTVTVTVEY